MLKMSLSMYLGIGESQPAGSASFEIPEGDAGTVATIKWIRKLIYQGVRDVDVNHAALAIVQGAPAHDQTAEAKAIYRWVRSNIRFTGDIYSAETLRPAKEILSVRAGDCDCINGVLLPTLLESVGIESRLVTVAADDSRPETFSHIYPEAHLDGQWVPMDAAAKSAAFGKEPSRVYRKRIWDVHSNQFEDVGSGPTGPSVSLARSGQLPVLNGLGQDDGDGGIDWTAISQELPQIISASTTGATSIIRAANAPAVTTVAAPTLINPQTGLPMTPAASAVATASVSTSGSMTGLVVIGLGLLVFAMLAIK